MKPRTLAVHAGHAAPAPGVPAPSSPPLHHATASLFHSLHDLEAAYEDGSMIYRRYGSPNQASLEAAVALLESAGGPTEALATASGMAAIHLACIALNPRGKAIVGMGDLYGGSNRLVREVLPNLGIETRMLDPRDPSQLEVALDGAGLLIIETIANPSMRVADIPALSRAAHAAGARLMVDNTFATPIHCRPLELGADVVMHSTTKYLGGHGDALGGVLVGDGSLVHDMRSLSQTVGASPGPLDCWLVLRGMRTLALRVEAASANAESLARWLRSQPGVLGVNYPGLTPEPGTAGVLNGGGGAMLSLEVEGGERGAGRFCEALELIPIMPSFADVATTISYPLGTSHRGLPDDQLEMAGVTPGLLRLSVGIEDEADLVEDLGKGLKAL